MQPTQPGWYWDPKGMPGLFRFWDGENWTEHISVTRKQGHPAPATPPRPDTDGRFHGGGLSCSVLPDPWTWAPDYPHVDDAIGQQVVVGRTPRGDYIGCVFIGGMPDEYLSSGSDLDAVGEAFSAAMLKTFYAHQTPQGDATPETGDISGHRTWQLAVRLDVKDDHLGFATEDAVFIVVERPYRPGVLYASLPDVTDVAMPSADDLVADLGVD